MGREQGPEEGTPLFEDFYLAPPEQVPPPGPADQEVRGLFLGQGGRDWVNTHLHFLSGEYAQKVIAWKDPLESVPAVTATSVTAIMACPLLDCPSPLRFFPLTHLPWSPFRPRHRLSFRRRENNRTAPHRHPHQSEELVPPDFGRP